MLNNDSAAMANVDSNSIDLDQAISRLENGFQPTPMVAVADLTKHCQLLTKKSANKRGEISSNQVLVAATDRHGHLFLTGKVYLSFATVQVGYPNAHTNNYLLDMDEGLIDPKYFYYFVTSNIGRELLSYHDEKAERQSANGASAEGTALSVMPSIRIPVPSLEVQRNIIHSLELVDQAKDQVKNIAVDIKNCLLGTDGHYFLKGKVQTIIDVWNHLTEYEIVKKYTYAGQSVNVEFQPTFSLNVTKQTKEKAVEDLSVTTVAAFLNTSGGALLIGLTSDGQLTGIEKEVAKLHKSDDKLLSSAQATIESRIAPQFHSFITYGLVECDDKMVLKIDCKAAPAEVYVDGKDFYVRTQAATEKLDGPDMVHYIRGHFKTV